MKKALFCILLVTGITGAAKAQLANSKWKGVLKLDNPVDVAFYFNKDTLTVINLQDNSVIETMNYTAKDSQFTLKKISGQSDCESSTVGKYKYQLKDNTMIITLVDDSCNDRAPYLNNLQLTKNI